MTIEQVIANVSSLSLDDQLRVAQAIWDSLPDSFGTHLSESRRLELDRRWNEYLADPSCALSEEEFRARTANGLK